jgi:hypothetical protein
MRKGTGRTPFHGCGGMGSRFLYLFNSQAQELRRMGMGHYHWRTLLLCGRVVGVKVDNP